MPDNLTHLSKEEQEGGLAQSQPSGLPASQDSSGLDAEPSAALWGIFNPDTGRWRTRAFRDPEQAKGFAAANTDNYTRLVAAPLFGPDALMGDEGLGAVREARDALGKSFDGDSGLWSSPAFNEPRSAAWQLYKAVNTLLSETQP